MQTWLQITFVIVFGLLAAEVLSQATSQPSYDPGPCWILNSTIHAYYGKSYNASTLQDCIEACSLSYSCFEIDWNPNNSDRLYCWLFGYKPVVRSTTGVSHYSFNIDDESCFGCWSPIWQNTRVQGGSLVANVSDTLTCKKACFMDTDCTGIDFFDSQCWLIRGGQPEGGQGVIHYEIIRQPGCSFSSPGIRTQFDSTTTPNIRTTTTTPSSTSISSFTSATVPATASTSKNSTGNATLTSLNTGISSSTTTTFPSSTSTAKNSADSEPQSSEGTSFILALPPAESASTKLNLSLTICTRSYDNVTVDVTYNENVTNSTVVNQALCQTVILPPSARMVYNDGSTWDNYVTVTASNLVSVVVLLLGSCSSFTAIPLSSLGTTYYAATLPPNNNTGDAAMIVITGILPTSVVLEFTSDITSASRNNITLCNSTKPLTTTQNYKITLSAGQSVCIWSKTTDLSGTKVTSLNSSSPIAVSAGNTRVSSSSGSVTNYVVLQMLPATLWSTNFMVGALTSNYNLTVISNSSNVAVSINGSPMITNSRGIIRYQNQNQPIQVSASQPVMVIQYGTSVPTAILIPGVESFRTSFNFMLPPMLSGTGSYTLVASSNNKVSYRLLVSGSKRMYSNQLTDYVSISLAQDRYLAVIAPYANVSFGAYVYYQDNSCAMGFPLAVGQQEPLLDASESVASPQAIKPAYIVLAGLGAANILLIIIAVIILCSYPIRYDDDVQNHQNGATSYSTKEKREKKVKKEKKSKKKQHSEDSQGNFTAGDVEMNANSSHTDVSENVESNPYFFNQNKDSVADYESGASRNDDVYGNQKEIDDQDTLKASYRYDNDQESSHAF